jgi:hypothetical protein
MKILFIFLTQMYNQNPSNTMQTVSSSMSTEPLHSRGIYLRPQPKKWESMINQRIGIVTLERLIDAAKHKQRYEVITYHAELPELWSPTNAPLLNDVAKDVLQNSKPGDSIKTLADKVVLMCALLLDPESAGSDKTQLIYAMESAYNYEPNEHFGPLLEKIHERLRWLKNQLQRRKASKPPMGGFHKKTKCRGSSKKSKSIKSRSRR